MIDDEKIKPFNKNRSEAKVLKLARSLQAHEAR